MNIKSILLSITLLSTSYLHSMNRYNDLRDVIYNHPDEPAIDYEIKFFKSDINKSTSGYDYPLRMAAYKHNEHAVASLLKHGAWVNAASKDFLNHTPLLSACYRTKVANEEKLLRIINMLLKSGADVNVQDEDGRTPLHLSVNVTKSIKASELLLAHDADINIKDVRTERPIDALNTSIWRAYRFKLTHDTRDITMFDWLHSVHRWNGKSQLRQLWITGAIVTARQIDAPTPRPIKPPAINTCTKIITYTKPNSGYQHKCSLM